MSEVEENGKSVILDNNSMKAWGGLQQGLSVCIGKFPGKLKEYKKTV